MTKLCFCWLNPAHLQGSAPAPPPFLAAAFAAAAAFLAAAALAAAPAGTRTRTAPAALRFLLLSWRIGAPRSLAKLVHISSRTRVCMGLC